MAEKKINIDMAEILRQLKADRKKLAIYACVGGVIGLIIAFTTPKKYESTVMLAPEESGQGFSGSISSLATMVGMNMKLGQTGDALYPEIYPDLVSSTDFMLKLFPMSVTTKKGDLTCDYYNYLLHHQKMALVDMPKAGMVWLLDKMKKKEQPRATSKDGKGPIWLTKDQSEVMKYLSGLIDCSVDKKTNVITLTVTDQDALIAATMADYVKNQLQVAITDYRTKKSRIDLEYMERLFHEAREQYDKARLAYAAYADANQDVFMQAYRMKLDDLENDMQLKYNIYQEVMEQLQLAKAKVQEKTPAFTVMQSATVPVKHSSTPKVVTLAIWIIIGLIVRIAVLAVNRWKKANS